MIDIVFYIQTFYSISIRFIDSNGLDIPDVTQYNEFTLVLNNTGLENDIIQFQCKNTLFNINNKFGIQFIENPCKYYLIEMKQGNQHVFNKTLPLGYINICKRSFEYVIDNTKYRYMLINGKYKLEILDKNHISLDELIDKNDEIIKESNVNKKDTIMALIDSNKTKKYSPHLIDLNIFIINDFNRYNLDKKHINFNTKNIFNYINKIYNKEGIKINIIGQLNISNNIENINNLNTFQQLMQEIKTNNDTMKNIDLFILFKLKDTKLNHDGVTFLNGAGTKNRNYSIVYLNNSIDYITNLINIRKIAHEIAHSIGVPHDDNNRSKNHLHSDKINDGFIMDQHDKEIYRKSLINLHPTFQNLQYKDHYLKFSNKSKMYIAKYYNKINSKKNITDPYQIVTSQEDAIKLINLLRTQSYYQIIKNKLNGKEPDTIRTKYYIIVGLLFYIFSICVAIYFIK
ncbi:hypothetical protein EBI_27098 [Enterocytozoon bieneusi H348]|nr:hypothetical protein EBI_27098 [Enterocytozoon bieneusi H348]|eukprot:XP_002649784.1 hypothetical protein EBI_27098 [Enterocytozoon bieneusi H348]